MGLLDSATRLARGEAQTQMVADGQIAAIAADRGFAVATRDTAPFIAAGVPGECPADC